MILYHPFIRRQPSPPLVELPGGRLVTREQAAAEQAAGAPNPYNLILENQANQARTLVQTILRKTAITTTPAGVPILPLPEPFDHPFNVAVVGNNLVVSSAEGLKIWIHQFELWNTVMQTIRLLDGTVDVMGPLVNFPAGAGLNLRWQDEPHFKLSYGKPFQINLTAGQVTGFLKYRMME